MTALTHRRQGGRALGPGLRRATALLVVLGAGACGAGCGGSSSHLVTSGRPRYLPKPTPVGRVLDASLARPSLGIEGDTIELSLPTGHVRATLVGPQVPEDGAAPIPNYSNVLFQLTLSGATGTVPLSGMDFTITDEIGRVSRPQLIPSQGVITTVGPVPTGSAAAALGPAPVSVAPGRTVVVDLVDPLIAVGDGKLAWAPGTRGHTVASWDFSVEVD